MKQLVIIDSMKKTWLDLDNEQKRFFKNRYTQKENTMKA